MDSIRDIKVHLLPSIVVNDAWMIAAKRAAKRANAFNIDQLTILMKNHKVPIDGMDEWCEKCSQDRENYGPLFMTNVVEELS